MNPMFPTRLAKPSAGLTFGSNASSLAKSSPVLASQARPPGDVANPSEVRAPSTTVSPSRATETPKKSLLCASPAMSFCSSLQVVPLRVNT